MSDKQIIVGFPTLCRYDLLEKAILSLEKGITIPDKYVVIDNGFSRQCSDYKGFREYVAKHGNSLPINKIEIIDTHKNWGVSKSWNFLTKRYLGHYLVISNDDIEFYPETLDILVKTRKSFNDEIPVVVACDNSKNNAFSLFMPTEAIVKRIGYFDQKFHPAYYEDCDYHRRILLDSQAEIHYAIGCDFSHGHSCTIKSYDEEETNRHHASFTKNKNYYIEKWGGDIGNEKYSAPFNKK